MTSSVQNQGDFRFFLHLEAKEFVNKAISPTMLRNEAELGI